MTGITALTIVVRSGSDTAAWLAAIGTILAAVSAVGIAIGTAWWARRNEIRRDQRRAWESQRDQVMRDLDETRRLLMIVTHHGEVLASPDLFGTMVHALVKHSRLVDSSAVATDMLWRWWKDGTGLNVLEALIETIDHELARLALLPSLAALDAPEPDPMEDPGGRII